MKVVTKEKIERLQAKIADCEYRIKRERGIQESLQKQITELENTEILEAVRAAGLVPASVREELKLYKQLRENGLLEGFKAEVSNNDNDEEEKENEEIKTV